MKGKTMMMLSFLFMYSAGIFNIVMHGLRKELLSGFSLTIFLWFVGFFHIKLITELDNFKETETFK